jgi:uncharacterized protein YndB with AHSA1/START domain
MADSRFVYVTYIRTTPAKLWNALRDPEFSRQIWSEGWIDTDWEQGSPWELRFPGGRVSDSGEILEIEPEKRLVLSWQHQVYPEMKADDLTRCTFDLEPVGESVKLTVVHECSKPDAKVIEGVSSGWPHILSSLKSLLETGESLVETRTWHGRW